MIVLRKKKGGACGRFFYSIPYPKYLYMTPKTLSKQNKKPKEKTQFARIINSRAFLTQQDDFPLPNLIEVQTNSYKWFLDEGIRELLEEISPVSDFSGKKLELHFLEHSIEEAKYDPETAKQKN